MFVEFLWDLSVVVDDDGLLVSIVDGINFDDATILTEVMSERWVGVEVVGTDLKIEDDNALGTSFVEPAIDERYAFPVLSWSIWTPYRIAKNKKK